MSMTPGYEYWMLGRLDQTRSLPFDVLKTQVIQTVHLNEELVKAGRCPG